MSPWETTIWSKRKQVQGLDRVKGARFALLCVEHAFRSSEEHFRCHLDAAVVDRMKEIIEFLWKQIEIRTNKIELDPMIKELVRLTPGEDDEEDFVSGWGYIPCGLAAAAACCLKGKEAGEYALEAAGQAYSCIQHQVCIERIYTHWEGIAGDEIDALERESQRCMQEVQFQSACLQAVAKGKRLTRDFLHREEIGGDNQN